MLSLSLLGRPVLVADGRPVSLTIRKTWALLLLLALDGAAPRPRVCAVLWPGLDESTSRRNLRRELARLREAGVPALLRADGDFLELHAAVALDTQQFDVAVAAGQPAQALALWRGPLADGLSAGEAPEFDDWLAAERERWRTRWRGALEAAAVAAEGAGAADDALTRLQTLLADDPLHERHHAAVMRLLAAAGRREAALAQYERCRALLAGELGLQPMAETEALAAMLRGAAAVVSTSDPATGPATPAATQALDAQGASAALVGLPDALPFVGRAAEVAALEEAWHAGCAVLIEGEGGVGKTRLALDFAAAHGPYALARCRPGDADVPYAAFTRALRALAGPTPQLPDEPAWVRDELSRLLPELGTAPQPIRSGEERSRFFEACARGWLALSADNFDAVLLDDWHHADAASRSLLAFVARRRREAAGGTGAREWLLLRPELDR
ncbi:MAG: BTAD domain-containing putative transcriptional regulator, partial [Rubrivivax sp.]|nr:BTAD domain-containing putative transcriptional regulator [Rubrivivax sp.]